MAILLVLIFAAVLIADIELLAALLFRYGKAPKKPWTGETPAGAVSSDDSEEKKNLMDEGFENIMRYSVGGKTGFEPRDNGE